MAWRKIFLVFAATIASLIIIALLFLPYISSWAIQRALSSQQFSEISIIQNRLGLGSAHFQTIAFTIPRAESAYHVIANSTQLSFSLGELLHGRIASLTVENLFVEKIDKLPTPAPTPFQLPALGSIAFPALPMGALTIKKLNLKIPGTGFLESIPIENLHISPSLSQLQLDFDVQLNQILPRQKFSPVLKLGALKIISAESHSKKISHFSLTLESNPRAGIRKISAALSGELSAQLFYKPQQSFLTLTTEKISIAAEDSLYTLHSQWKDHSGALIFDVDATYNNSNHAVNISYAFHPIKFNGEGHSLKNIFGAWPFTFDLNQGELRIAGKATLQTQPKLWLDKLIHQVALENLTGEYGNTKFSQLNANAEFYSQKSQKKIMVPKITITSIDPGFPMQNISADFQADWDHDHPTIQGKHFSADLLKGKAMAENFTIQLTKLNPRTKPIALHLAGLDLQELLKLKQGEEFSASGILDGKIPLFIHGGGVTVNGGTLQARHPGTLTYIPSDNAAGFTGTNSTLKIVLDALRNFHYSELRTQIDFTPEGKLTLDVALRGKNPDFQSGQTVHFNINVEENLLALLQSLSYAGGDFDKEIDDRVQAAKENHFKKKTK